MRRPRLLAISPDFSATGAPIALFNVLRGLAERYDILIAAQADGALREAFLSAGITAIALPNLITDANLVAHLLLSHDVVVANTLVAAGSIHAASQLKKPSLWYLHEGHSGAAFIRQYTLIAPAFALADYVGYPSRFSQELYAPLRGQRKFALLPYGVPRQADTSAPDDAGRLKILQLGSIEPRKGQDMALAAMRLLKDVPVELTIAGRILDAAYHKRLMTDFGDVANVRWSAEATRESALDLIRQCHVLIVPSRDEVTPVVILEAMSLGRVVVASRICGIPEMITHDHSGLMFERDNVQELASLLQQLYENPSRRRQLSENARAAQREHWTVEHAQRRFGELIDALLSRRIS